MNGTADGAKLVIDSNDNLYISWKDVGGGERAEGGKKKIGNKVRRFSE